MITDLHYIILKELHKSSSSNRTPSTPAQLLQKQQTIFKNKTNINLNIHKVKKKKKEKKK